MLKLKPGIPNAAKIKNIIFDFGGVICDLDIERTKEKFREFGPPKETTVMSDEARDRRFQEIVDAYEMSLLVSQGFRNMIKDYYLVEPTNQAVDEAWNAMLAGIPTARIRLLEDIRQTYRIFLLSNSNEIHYNFYLREFLEPYGYRSFDELFERAWFSFKAGMRKPDPNLFEFVLHDKLLIPEETLFIDDLLIHIETARTFGINGYHLAEGKEITDLFE